MTADDKARRDQALEQELAELREQHKALETKKIRTEEKISSLTERLKDLEKRATEEFGTADPEELQRILDEKRKENERVVAEYRKHVDGIRKGLEEVEQRFGGGEG
ncbi:hypothetical protein [Desulfovibrio oxyclinae]|jgi:predicted  nucleic acid-binding Zn-ribbon protein|uniref:hypothetical protein n=1 Tax=Desulfovibrio oxyclinae TaxID=63560 RepID=UPI0003743249|nr:hypothetical protein [Desulfovibrio oxyclinae]